MALALPPNRFRHGRFVRPRTDPKAPTKRELHALLGTPRGIESRFTLDIVRLFRALHAEVERVVLSHLHRETVVERPGEEPPLPVERTDAPTKGSKGGAQPVPAGARVAAAGAVSAKLLGDISNHVRKGGGVAFTRMATAIHAKSGETVPSLIPITPAGAGIENLVDDVRDESLSYLENAGRAYASQVRDVLEDPDNFELPIAQLTDLIRERADVSMTRASTIARTTTSQLHSGIMAERHKSAGITHFVWSTSNDERVRGNPTGLYPKADPSHFDLDGETYAYDDPPEADVDGGPCLPGEAINCFPGDSEIQFADGVEKGFRRWYDGELTLVVTDSGKTIRGTPNHPVLTRRGWIALGELKLSDHLVEVSEETLATAKAHQDYGVVRIGDIFASLEKGCVSWTTRYGAADFHGDAREGDVDIVSATWPLTFGVLSCDTEGLKQLRLANADSPALRLCSKQEFGLGTFAASQGVVSLGNNRSTVDVAGFYESDHVRFRTAPYADAQPKQPREQCDALDAGTTRDRQKAFSSLVGRHDGLHIDVGVVPGPTADSMVCLDADSAEFLTQIVGMNPERSGHLIQGLPGLQKLSRVLRIDRLAFSGHVFNLSTRSGWYVSQGILAHNCRCVAVPVVPDEDEEEETPDESSSDDDDE